MRPVRIIFFTCFLLCAFLPVWGGGIPAGARMDSSELVLHAPDTAQLSAYRSDKDFAYFGDLTRDAFSWWDIILLWLRRISSSVFSNEGLTPYLRYTLIVLVFLFLAYRLFGGRFQGFLAGREGSEQGISPLTYQVHAGRLDADIEKELRDGNLRNAIRLMYIQLLLDLEGKNLVRIRKEKTGRDYLDELRGHPVQPVFRDINRAFEYTWYGEFEPDIEGFGIIRRHFEKAKTSLE
ncbi:MAG: hypothetical protein U0T82_00630 [Bacteroidales bacterium]